MYNYSALTILSLFVILLNWKWAERKVVYFNHVTFSFKLTHRQNVHRKTSSLSEMTGFLLCQSKKNTSIILI